MRRREDILFFPPLLNFAPYQGDGEGLASYGLSASPITFGEPVNGEGKSRAFRRFQ